jgi:polar amino acid transport system substrate-binding protein
VTAVSPEVVRALAPTGELRAAINFGNAVIAQRREGSGEPAGISADLARALGERIARPVRFVPYEAAREVAASAADGVWDIAFLAIDPLRADTIDFTAPYVAIEGAYVVRSHSTLRSVADVDRPGIRIAVGAGSAYDLFLSRSLRHAEIVRAPGSAATLDMFWKEGIEVRAGIRQSLEKLAAKHPDLRVLEEAFMAIRQAIAVPKGRAAALPWLDAFLREMKASGFVASALARSGHGEVTVSP